MSLTSILVGIAILLGVAGLWLAFSLTPEARRVLWNYRQIHQIQTDIRSTLDLTDANLPADEWMRRLNDPKPFVRASAVAGLARQQDRRAIEPLARELQRISLGTGSQMPSQPKPDPAQDQISLMTAVYIPRLLLEAASLLPDPSYIPFLEQWLERAPGNEDVRDVLAACRRLSPQRNEAGPAAAVGHTVGQTADPTNDRPAAEAEPIAAVAVLRDLPRLRRMLSAATPDQLLRALEGAAAGLGMDEAKTVIEREIFRRPEADIARAASRWARSADPHLRMVAAMALGRYSAELEFGAGDHWNGTPSKDAAEILSRLMVDPVPTVAKAAVASIPLIEEFPVLPEAAEHPEEDVRETYVHRTYVVPDHDTWIGDEKKIAILLKFLRDPSEKVRQMTYGTIYNAITDVPPSSFRHRTVVRDEVLAVARDDKAPMEWRAPSMGILARFQDAAVVPLIGSALAGLDPSVADASRVYIYMAIDDMPDASYIPGLERYRDRIIQLNLDGQEDVDELIAKCRKARLR